jgi:hypothetical protein
MKIYVKTIRKLFFKIPMLNQIDRPYGVLWIAKTRDQDWDAKKMETLVTTLLLCHAIQIVSALHCLLFLGGTEKGRFAILFNKSSQHGWHFDDITYRLLALYRYLEICNSLYQ